MSLSLVRPYFEKCAKDLGFKVSDEAFSAESLARNSGKQAFISLQPATTRKQQSHIEQTLRISVKLFIGQSRQTKDLEKKGFEAGDEFVTSVFLSHRTSPFSRVVCTSLQPQPITTQNDNAVAVDLEFEATVLSLT